MCRRRTSNRRERGIALVLTLMLLMLFSVFSVGLYLFMTAETRASSADYFSNQAFYAAMAGIEKMTNDVNKLYLYKNQPTASDFTTITANPPTVSGYTFTEYRMGFNGSATTKNITSGPYEGLVALVQPYKLFVTATGNYTKSETRLRRDFLTDLIPIFQFGIFYDGDLEAHAGPNFNFGGRVHTNRDFYITAGSTTLFNSRVTVVGEVVRDVRKNGDSAGPPSFGGNVYVLDNTGAQKELIMSGTGQGGSVIGGSGRPGTPSGSLNPNWVTYSPSFFGGNLINYSTGAKALTLPLQLSGNSPIELIKRGKTGDSSVLQQNRFFYKPVIRIFLSDVSSTSPYIDPAIGGGGCRLSTTVSDPSGIARCTVGAGKTPLGGWLAGKNYHFKVDFTNTAGVLVDATQEFLNQGISAGDSTALIRLQRNDCYTGSYGSYPSGDCSGGQPGQYPIMFYDIREGEIEDSIDTNVGLTGIMAALELNMNNLGKWLAGQAPYAGLSGNQVMNINGYAVYTSDRRGEQTGYVNGEFDYKETIFRNGLLDAGEDPNGVVGSYPVLPIPEGPVAGAEDVDRTTGTFVNNYMLAEPRLFRRCLRLVNGAALQFPTTVISENPIYIYGDYNNGTSGTKQPAAIIGDAVTILSNAWSDANSYNNEDISSSRFASATTVQAAFIAGSTQSIYASPAPSYNQPHSSGGVHNLMRFLENWGGVTMTYTGSLVNLYTSRQAIGQWKCCATVYSPPIRNWSFDVGFLDPTKLPPLTPHITILEMQRFRQDLYQTLAP